MALPVLPAVVPPSIVGQLNGHISAEVLTNVGGSSIRLLADEAAVSFVRLRDACLLATGVFLYIMGGGAYRSYQEQVSEFRKRYQTPAVAGLPAGKYRRWDDPTLDGGERLYSLRPGFASLAVPGFSNHGWGIAVDIAEPIIDDETGKVIGSIRIDLTDAWPWLLTHAVEFGWSWELQDEPWHLRLVRLLSIPIPPEDEDMPTEIKLIASDGTQFVWNPPTNTLRWVNDGNVAAIEAAAAFAAIFQGTIPNENSVDDGIRSLIANTVKAGIAPNAGLFQGAW